MPSLHARMAEEANGHCSNRHARALRTAVAYLAEVQNVVAIILEHKERSIVSSKTLLGVALQYETQSLFSQTVFPRESNRTEVLSTVPTYIYFPIHLSFIFRPLLQRIHVCTGVPLRQITARSLISVCFPPVICYCPH